MSLLLNNPQRAIDRIVAFLQHTYQEHNAKAAVIAVSGGIDSALAFTLLTRALPKEQIVPVLLPYGWQNMDDAKTMCVWNGIEHGQWVEITIKPIADGLINALHIPSHDTMRRGNVMARVRMIAVYDIAKATHGLVCGTENKSEHFLGYFTRFGDAASDVEPLVRLYKTQVRQLAVHLNIPQQILAKHPSAGLWNGQTDEAELGFSYEEADKVLERFIDKKEKPERILIDGIAKETVQAVVARVQAQAFKHKVPYHL